MMTSAPGRLRDLGRHRGVQPHVDGRPGDHPRLIVEVAGEEPLERHLLLAAQRRRPGGRSSRRGSPCARAPRRSAPPACRRRRRRRRGRSSRWWPAARAGESCSKPISGLTAQRYWRFVVMPAKHSKQRMHGLISSALPARAFLGRSGSAIMARAASTTSALPEAMISSMSSGSPSAPTVATGVLTCFLISAA